MKFPSFKMIGERFVATLKRFPFALTFAYAGALSGIIFIEISVMGRVENTLLPNLIATCVLGFFLFTALRLFSERQSTYRYTASVLGILFLILFFVFLPRVNMDDYPTFEVVLTTVLLGFSFISGVTFTPFLKKYADIGFWQHVKELVVRLFFTFIFAGVLFLGLTLAITGAQELLGIQFEFEIFPELFIFITGFIATTFFLAGIPSSTAALEKRKKFPEGVRIFTQFILLPLFLIYAVILYAYSARIIFTDEVSTGLISWLVIVFVATGLIAYFLLFPTLLERKPVWTNRTSKLIFILIIPMIGMLFWDMGQRIAEHGLTEPRYFGILFGLWSLGLSIYYLVSELKSLRIINVSMTLLLLLSAFGPWGALALSESNQLARIETVLEKYDILQDGKIVKNDQEIAPEDAQIVTSAMDYLIYTRQSNAVKAWFEGMELPEYCGHDSYCLAEEGLGITPVFDPYFFEPSDYSYYYYSDENNEPISVAGYDYLYRYIFYYDDPYFNPPEPSKVRIENEILTMNNTPVGVIQIDLSQKLDELANQSTESQGYRRGDNQLSEELATIETSRLKLVITHLELVDEDDPTKRKIQSLDAMLMLKAK